MQQDRSTAVNVNDAKRALGWSPLHPTNERGQYVSTKVGRNEPCPCSSGRKYKKCCGDPTRDQNTRELAKQLIAHTDHEDEDGTREEEE